MFQIQIIGIGTKVLACGLSALAICILDAAGFYGYNEDLLSVVDSYKVISQWQERLHTRDAKCVNTQ